MTVSLYKRWEKRGSDCRRADRKRLSGDTKVSYRCRSIINLPNVWGKSVIMSLTVSEVRYGVS